MAFLLNPELASALADMAARCVACNICVAQCGFLQQYGNPADIANNFDPADEKWAEAAYACALCSLCRAVCPKDLDPARLFLEMRKNAAAANVRLKGHNRILAYEKRGTSRRYTYYGFPDKCNTVFFPGCTLPGTRPKTTKRLIRRLRSIVPDLGVVLDCCTKPSHDLGRTAYFEAMFREMNRYLTDCGITRILTACPNCHRVFSRYGHGLEVETVYTFLAASGQPFASVADRPVVSVHDPCPLRFEDPILDAARHLVTAAGMRVHEMRHSRNTTVCCGEGGSVSLTAGELARKWQDIRINEAGDTPLVTYCAGCAGFLSKQHPTHHLLDLLFEPEKIMAGRIKPAKAPMTYFHRLQLKRWLKKNIPAALSRERRYQAACA